MRRRVENAFFAIVTLLGALSAAPPASASPELRVDGARFVDAAGRVVVLRGVNAAGNAKVPPFRPVTGPAFFDPVASWGMNVVRLLFTWEAYEPERGRYDEGYLDYYAAAAAAAASRGLYVIVDFHQDAYSRFTVGGCGEGFPRWALAPWVWASRPNNGASCAAWGAAMIVDVPMHAAWGAFHDGFGGYRAAYARMVERVARRLAGNAAVVGYDMMNEPWGDEPTDLYDLYEEVGAAIRRADPSAILFVSPHALTSAGQRSNLRRPSFGNIAFSPHFYDPSVVVWKAWSGASPEGAFAKMRAVADAWGVPLFVGEFGGGADVRGVDRYVAALYDALDATLASGAQWAYTPGWTPAAKDGWNHEDLSLVDDRGAVRASFVARPYPRRVAGAPVHFALARASGPEAASVELVWDHTPGRGETELYVPAAALFGGPMAISAEGPGVACRSVAASLVTCTSASAGRMRVVVRRGGGS